MRNFNVAGNFNARVFIFPDGIFKCGLKPQFFECISVDSVAQDRGDITKFECPSPYAYGKFEEVASISGELSRATTTITTYMSRIAGSEFFSLFERDCSFDMHVHFGECQNPSDFNSFDKALIFEDVRATSWGTDPLIALTSGDKSVIQETLDISSSRVVELINLQYSEVDPAGTVDGAFVKGLVADTRSCGGTCGSPSDGCQVQFAVTDDGYLYYSVDGGYTWNAEQVIDIVATPTTIPEDMMVIGDTLIILTEDDLLYIVDRTDFLEAPTNAALWDVANIGASILGSATDSAFNTGVIVGAAGKIAKADIYGELTLVEDGSITSENLLDVDVHQFGVILAGGENGAIVYSLDDGETWDAPSNLPTNDDVTSVLVKNGRNWLIGTATGELWCTDNYGVTWDRVSYPGWNTATAPVLDMQANSAHVVYMLQNNRLLKSIDGGASWQIEPSNSKKPFPTITKTSIATCWDDINTVAIMGENGGTGSIVKGSPSN